MSTGGMFQTVVGQYRIIELLGEGGFAKTYLAKDVSENHYAIKHFSFTGASSRQVSKAKELFQREVAIAKKLNGPNRQIPRFFDYLEINQELYFVQEYIQGQTLADEINTRRNVNQNITEAEIIFFLEEILNILQFIHEEKFIHRDINPKNIIRRKQDHKFVLIDFGAVKEVAQTITQMHPQTQIYTPGYAPREQMQGNAKFNSDIYALGMTAIQVLTGLEPSALPIDQNGEVIWQDQVDISDRLVEIIKKMVHENYQSRYQTADQVLTDLCNSSSNAVTPTKTYIPPSSHVPVGNHSYTERNVFLLFLISIAVAILSMSGFLPQIQGSKENQIAPVPVDTK